MVPAAMLLNLNASRDASDREFGFSDAKPFPVDRRALFRQAWAHARIMARRFGGSAKKHFAGCLKGAWKQLRPQVHAPVVFPSRTIAREIARQRFQPPRWRYANAFHAR
jgi:hypothetical protein